MPMHRKNSTKHVGGMSQDQVWFTRNVERVRKRKDIAKASKRKNRGKK